MSRVDKKPQERNLNGATCVEHVTESTSHFRRMFGDRLLWIYEKSTAIQIRTAREDQHAQTSAANSLEPTENLSRNTCDSNDHFNAEASKLIWLTLQESEA